MQIQDKSQFKIRSNFVIKTFLVCMQSKKLKIALMLKFEMISRTCFVVMIVFLSKGPILMSVTETNYQTRLGAHIFQARFLISLH